MLSSTGPELGVLSHDSNIMPEKAFDYYVSLERVQGLLRGATLRAAGGGLGVAPAPVGTRRVLRNKVRAWVRAREDEESPPELGGIPFQYRGEVRAPGLRSAHTCRDDRVEPHLMAILRRVSSRKGGGGLS